MAMARRPSVPRAVVGSAEFKSRCLEFVDHVKEARAEYIVTRHGRPVARLVPVEADRAASVIGALTKSVQRYDGPFDPVPGAWDLNAPEDER